MRAAERLALREPSWRELDGLLHRLEHGGISRRRASIGTDAASDLAGQGPRFRGGGALTGQDLLRLAELHRAACADLMLAEAHDLPGDTVGYLHALVARGHNALYRARGLSFRKWAVGLLNAVPASLRRDLTLPIAAALFWGPFLVCAYKAATEPGFAEMVVGEVNVAQMEEMYEKPISSLERDDAMMAGFYIMNNAGIGLLCYGSGLSFGILTIVTLLGNAIPIGTIFGHMVFAPQAPQFFTFVTAHAPFELTAIVFAGAAGLRLGWGTTLAVSQRVAGLPWSHGVELLRREAKRSLPVAGSAVFLFVLAAFLEGFVSASALPYWVKASLAVFSAALLVAYVALGGRGPSRGSAAP